MKSADMKKTTVEKISKLQKWNTLMQFECQNSNYSGPIIVALTKIGISHMGNELSGSVAHSRGEYIFFPALFLKELSRDITNKMFLCSS
jgi:hypothetical protein